MDMCSEAPSVSCGRLATPMVGGGGGGFVGGNLAGRVCTPVVGGGGQASGVWGDHRQRTPMYRF
jgi:hypothetical protein